MNLKDLVIDEDAMDRFLDAMLKETNIQAEKVENLYLKIKDLESLESYFKELYELEKELPLGEELEQYWTLVELASMYGKTIPEDYIEDINYFISEIYHYKGYLFGIMHGQGSTPWWAPWDQYKHILGPEQLSLNM